MRVVRPVASNLEPGEVAFRRSVSFKGKAAKAAAADEAASASKPKKKKGTKKAAAPKLSKTEKLVEVDFSKKLKANPDVADAFSGIIHLVLSGADGGRWTIDLTRDAEWISRGLTGKPKLTVRTSAKDFVGLVKGEKNAQMAVMSGDLELEPMDLDLAMKLGPLFR